MNFSSLPKSGRVTTIDPALVKSVNDLASTRGGTPAKEPEPPKDTTPPDKTPPAPNAGQIEPPKEQFKAPEPDKAPPAEEPKGIKQVREALERATEKAKGLETSLTATAAEKAAEADAAAVRAATLRAVCSGRFARRELLLRHTPGCRAA